MSAISASSASAGARRVRGTSTCAPALSQPASAPSSAPRRSAASTSSTPSRLRGPLGHRARREDRRARLGGVLARRTAARVAANDELRLEERPAGHVREHELQAVVEPRAREGREVVGPGLACRRAACRGRRAGPPRCSVADARRLLRAHAGGLGGRAGDVREDGPGVRSEGLRARGADGLRVDREIAAELLVDELGPVEVRRIHREPVGDLVHARQRAVLGGFDERVRACQLVVGHGLAGHPLELLVEDGLDRRRVRLGSRGDPARGDRRAGHERQREERDVLRDLLVAHEPAMEAAAPAAREDVGRDLERVELARPERPGSGSRRGPARAARRRARPRATRASDRAEAGGTTGRSGFGSIGPNSRSAASKTAASSTSPATVSTALLGT